MKYVDYLAIPGPCPFCEREQGTIAENSTAWLTYPLAPYHPDHLLVIPKRHIEYILDITKDEMRDIDALLKTGLQMLKSLGYDNVSFLVRQGKESGKSVAHLHYHIIPDIVLGNSDHAGEDREIVERDVQEAKIAKFRSMATKIFSNKHL